MEHQTIQDKRKRAAIAVATARRKSVVSSLTGYQLWAGPASETGRLTPVQFLAVVLWAVGNLQGRELTDSEEISVLSDGWFRLTDATARKAATLGGCGSFREVVPYNALTLLEIEASKVTSPNGWAMGVDDVDAWLQGLGYGAWCTHFFDSCGVRGDQTSGAKQRSKDDDLLVLLHAYEVRGKGVTRSMFADLQKLGEDALRKRLIAARKLKKTNAEKAAALQKGPWAGLSTVVKK